MIDRIIKSEKIEWRKIKDLQPKRFKTRLNDSVLRATLLKHGVALSFSVWQDKKGDIWCIDGHQRIKVLNELIEAGEHIPDLLSAEFIEAKDKKEAMEILIEVFNQKRSLIDMTELELAISDMNLELDLDFADLDLDITFDDEDEYEDSGVGGAKELSNMIMVTLTDEEIEEWQSLKDEIGKQKDKTVIFELINFYKNEKGID